MPAHHILSPCRHRESSRQRSRNTNYLLFTRLCAPPPFTGRSIITHKGQRNESPPDNHTNESRWSSSDMPAALSVIFNIGDYYRFWTLLSLFSAYSERQLGFFTQFNKASSAFRHLHAPHCPAANHIYRFDNTSLTHNIYLFMYLLENVFLHLITGMSSHTGRRTKAPDWFSCCSSSSKH